MVIGWRISEEAQAFGLSPFQFPDSLTVERQAHFLGPGLFRAPGLKPYKPSVSLP